MTYRPNLRAPLSTSYKWPLFCLMLKRPGRKRLLMPCAARHSQATSTLPDVASLLLQPGGAPTVSFSLAECYKKCPQPVPTLMLL